MSDRMVVVAHIVSRSEAIVIASMLDAAGIILHVGGQWHSSVHVNSVALGGFRITVPEWQHFDASQVIADTFANDSFQFSEGLQSSVIKFVLIWLGTLLFSTLPYLVAVSIPPIWLLYLPFMALMVPVNPQGRGDYYLCSDQSKTEI